MNGNLVGRVIGPVWLPWDFRTQTGWRMTCHRDQLRHLFSDWQEQESHSVAKTEISSTIYDGSGALHPNGRSRQLIFLKSLWMDLGEKEEPTIIWSDSKTAIKITTKVDISHGRTKYINVCEMYVRDLVAQRGSCGGTCGWELKIRLISLIKPFRKEGIRETPEWYWSLQSI